MAGGRPTTYTPELGVLICERISTMPFGIHKLCELYEDMPNPSTVFLWLTKHSEFSDNYIKAREFQAEVLANECMDIADDCRNDYMDALDDEQKGMGYRQNGEHVNRSRLRIETRKFFASKLLPKRYGDHKQIEQLQDSNSKLQQELNELRAQLAEKYKKDY